MLNPSISPTSCCLICNKTLSRTTSTARIINRYSHCPKRDFLPFCGTNFSSLKLFFTHTSFFIASNSDKDPDYIFRSGSVMRTMILTTLPVKVLMHTVIGEDEDVPFPLVDQSIDIISGSVDCLENLIAIWAITVSVIIYIVKMNKEEIVFTYSLERRLEDLVVYILLSSSSRVEYLL